MFYTLLLLIFTGISLVKIILKNLDDILSLTSLFLLNIMGFKVNIDSLQNVPKKSVMVMAHTSIYDGIFATMIYHAFFRKEVNIYFMIKEEFGIPAQTICENFFPYTRVIPINNNSMFSQNVVKKIVDELKDNNDYVLCIAPEGTRKLTSRIKSGFYYIAKELNVPVVFCGIDFSNKSIEFTEPRKMGNSFETEKIWFGNMCKKYIPLYPENCFYTTDYYTQSSSTIEENNNSTFEYQNELHENNSYNSDSESKTDSYISNNSYISDLSN